MRWWIQFNLVFLLLCVDTAQAQRLISFNRTDHDFGNLAPGLVPAERDFVFRNTGQQPLQIVHVRSEGDELSFVFTKSSVLAGEYGFVKARLTTSELRGLFHREIFVTIKYGDSILAEVIHVRAVVQNDGNAAPNRQFTDGAAAISVEVEPDEIALMQQLSGADAEAVSKAQIAYLKDQLAIKSALIDRLSTDLDNKEASELATSQQLIALQEALATNDAKATEAKLAELMAEMNRLRTTDDDMRTKIAEQRALEVQWKIQADNATATAQRLSQQLEQQFAQQALADERATNLEDQLKASKALELTQQQRIDSLNSAISIASRVGTDTNLSRLKKELEWREKEQKMQTEQQHRQQQQLENLAAEHHKLRLMTDSLNLRLASRQAEASRNELELLQSQGRMAEYEEKIARLSAEAAQLDSLRALPRQLDSLNAVLSESESESQQLANSILEKQQEIASLQKQREGTERTLAALEQATNRQLDETHKLMHRVADLAAKEALSRARLENARDSLAAAKSNAEAQNANNEKIAAELNEWKKEASEQLIALNQLQREEEQLRQELATLSEKGDTETIEAVSLSAMIDSLNNEIASKTNSTESLNEELKQLRIMLGEAKSREDFHLKETDRLESSLETAWMSNRLAFDEVRADVEAMRLERDSLYEEARQLKSTLDKMTGTAAAFTIALGEPTTSSVERNAIGQLAPVVEWKSDAVKSCTFGVFTQHAEAEAFCQQLRDLGYVKAHILPVTSSTAMPSVEKFDSAAGSRAGIAH